MNRHDSGRSESSDEMVFDRPTRLRRFLSHAALPILLAATVIVGADAWTPPAGAQESEPMSRTAQITDSQEQLKFGVQMARRGLWSEALFRFKQARRLDPNNSRILNNMAVAYEALGHFDRALEAYQEAVRADTSNRELRRNYSRFVEFYRAFRPDDQKDASLDESSATAEAGTDPEAANDNAPDTGR